MTSATDELRRLLDERGVKWMPIAWNPKKETFYHTLDGVGFCADEYADGVRIYTDATITPQQAIDATLGRGTCRDVGRYAFVCSVCGWASDEPHHVLGGFWPKYCPECGRVVVNDQ